MDSDDERALEILDAFAKAPREVGGVTLSQEYLEHIARLEAHPDNQPGADKTSRDQAQSAFLDHFRRARPL
jgi:hypothetical protein